MPEPNYANVFSDFELALPTFWFSHCFSTAQSCPILCDPMDCSSPGSCPSLSPRVCSNSCPLNWWCHPSVSSFVMPFLPLPSIFLSTMVFQWVGSLHQVLKYWSFGFSISPMYISSNVYSGLISFRIDWFDLLAVQGTLKSLLQHHSLKHQFFSAQPSLWFNSYIYAWLHVSLRSIQPHWSET